MQKRVLWTAVVSMLTLFVTSSGITSAEIGLDEALKTWTVQTLDYLQGDNGEVLVSVKLGHADYLLNLKPHSLRSVDFKVQLQREGGVYVDYDPPAPSTYRGEVIGVPGSAVAASLIRDQLFGVIRLGEEEIWYVEPMSRYVDNAGLSDYVIYSSTDVLPVEGGCGNDYYEMPEDVEFELETADLPRLNVPGSGKYLYQRNDELCDIAFDTDYEFFQKYDNDPDLTVQDIENNLNGVEIIYLRDTQICYNITHMIIRTTSDDPYSGWDPNDLLDQFRSHWRSEQTDVPRDIAHLHTGRSFGGVLGMAWISTICSTWYGYGFTKRQANYNNWITTTAHELGHNWSAQHCDGDGDCHIMCSVVNGCDGVGLPNFGTAAIASINNHKSTRTCLDDGCEEVMDITEPDPGIAGEPSSIGVRGAAAGSSVRYYFNVPAGSWEVPECPGLFLDIDTPRKWVTTTADANGNASITMTVPSGMVGRTLRMQAADITTCVKSDVEIYTFE